MDSNILDFPVIVNSQEISENEYCRKLLSDNSFSFPNFSELIDSLQNKPLLIGKWLSYSEDRRGSPTFYFRKSGECYEVGFASKLGIWKIGDYRDASFACALFVKLEFEGRLLNLQLESQIR